MTKEAMESRLREAYPDAEIEVFDLTGTQDHWEVQVISKSFEGMSLVRRHQDVMGRFSDELASGEVHALSIKTKTQ